MIPRFHCPFELNPGAHVELHDEAAHHALRVLRLGAGDTAILFDGRGGQWRASLHPAGKRMRATLEEFMPDDRESPLAVTLVQSLPAGDKMDFVIQKAVELGVACIAPVIAKRSVVRLSGERMERRLDHWRSVAIAACEQSGRNRLPELTPIVDLPQYLAQAMAQNHPRWVCLPEADRAQRLRDLPPPGQQLSLLIGPESGFEPLEVKAVMAAGFTPLSLGPRVLRTETAGPAAVAVVQSLWGDI